MKEIAKNLRLKNMNLTRTHYQINGHNEKSRDNITIYSICTAYNCKEYKCMIVRRMQISQISKKTLLLYISRNVVCYD